MDMVVGAELFSKRGWAPNGDFRYKGRDLDHLICAGMPCSIAVCAQVGSTTSAASNQPAATLPGPVGFERVNQGGVDVVAEGRKDISPHTHASGTVEYLSSYVYRLVFNDNFSQAVSSQVASNVSITHSHNGFIPSVSLGRLRPLPAPPTVMKRRILHLPSVRIDVLERPLAASPLYWGLGSSISYLSRSEPRFPRPQRRPR